MAAGLEPAFAPGRPVWPLAALAGLEPDDPDLEIPFGALRKGIREAPERYFVANQNGLITVKPHEPLAPEATKADKSRKWKLALLVSCCLHVAVALFFFQATDEAVQIEGADFAGVAVLGTASADQVQSGEISEDEATVDVTMVTLLDATPVENLEAKAVPVDETVAQVETAKAVTTDVEILKPVEEMPVERGQPTDRLEAATAEPQAPARSDRAEPEISESTARPAVTETVPEVLATDRADLVDDDNVVQKPAKTQAAETVETAETEPVGRVEPVEEVTPKPKAEAETERPVERTAEPATPIQNKPVAEKKTAKKAEARKPAEKADTKQKKAGKGGQNETDARRGQADGQEKGDSRQASRGGSRNGEVGNAAVSNYPGKVRSKLARVARSVRAKGRGQVLVAFSVGSNGGVRSARVARSSGVDSVDQAALQAVRKASPFPPIPANAGRATWEFSVPLAFRR
jgi:protein TonB